MSYHLWNVEAANDVELCDIEAADLAETLRILAVVEMLDDAVKSQIEADQLTNHGDGEWLRRATNSLGFARMAQKRCARRLRVLGHVDPAESYDARAARQQKQIEGLNLKLRRADIDKQFVAAAAEMIDPKTHAEILAVAAARVQATADAVEVPA